MAISDTITIDAGPAIAQLNEVAAAADKAAASLDKLKAGGASGAGADKLAASMDKAAASIQAAVDKINASLAKVSASADAAGAGLDRIGVVADEAGAGLDRAATGADAAAAANARLAATADAAGASLDKQAVAGERAGAAGAASGAGWKTLGTVMLGAGVAAAYGIDKAMKFQSQMLLLNTQAGVSIPKVKQMSQGVLEVSTQTGQSLSNVAESAYHVASNMASMGTTVPKMMNAVKVAAEGAAVGHANMVDVTNALTAAIASGIPGVKDYSQAMGALNATVGSGDMSMQDLADAMGTGAVAAVKGYGLSLKDTGAALAVFGDNNIRGAKAGTDLRVAVQSLAVPAAAGKDELKKLGLTTTSLAKDMQSGGLLKALDDLTTRFKANGITAKNEGEVITTLFGKKAGVGLSLLLEQMDRLKSKYPDITKGANDFNKAWEKTQQSPAQKWKEAVAGLQASATGFGTELLPAFSKVVGFADRILADINGSKAGATAIAASFGGLAALFIGKKLFSGVETALGTLGKMGSFLKIPGLDKLANIGQSSGLTGAAADLAGAAADLSGAAAKLSGAGEEGLLGGGKGVPGAAKVGPMATAGAVIGGAVVGAVATYVAGHLVSALIAKPTPEQVKKYKQQTPGWLQDFGNLVFGQSGASSLRFGYGQAARTSVGNWWADLFGGRGGAPPQHTMGPIAPGMQFHQAGAIPQALHNVAHWFDNARHAPMMPLHTIANTFDTARHGAASFGAGAAHIATGGFTAAGHAIESAFSGARSHVASVMSGIASAVSSAGSKAAAAAASGFHAVESAVSSAFSAAASAASAGAGRIVSALAGLPGKLASIGSAAVAGLARGISAGIGAVVGAAERVAGAVGSAMSRVLHIFSPSKVTQKIGANAAQGLVLGLEGGKTTVDAAATALGKNVAKAADIQSIDSTVKKLLADVPKGDSGLTKMLQADQSKLTSLANQRAKLEAEITDAQDIAKQAISNANITGAADYQPVLAASSGPLAASATISGMQGMAADAKQFAQVVGQLQKQGLNATSLSQIVQAGPSALPQALGLAQGGKGAISQVNALEKQIQASAAKLGNTAAPAMYQAGVDAGKGLAAGLKSQLSSVEGEIKKLAQAMVNAIKGALKSHSPSLVMADVGVSIPQGVALGVDRGTGTALAAMNRMSGRLATAPFRIPQGYGHPAAGGGSGGSGGGSVTYVTNVNVTVNGSVQTERDLVNAVQQGLLRKGNNNWSAGVVFPGRRA